MAVERFERAQGERLEAVFELRGEGATQLVVPVLSGGRSASVLQGVQTKVRRGLHPALQGRQGLGRIVPHHGYGEFPTA